MKSRRFYLFSIALLCIFILQSPILSQTPTPTPIPATADAASEIVQNGADLIHPGDLVDVDVVGSVEYDWRGGINPEGFLDGVDAAENPIYALCRSETEIAREVEKAYGKILRDPQVVVKILDRSNRPLVILYGAVKTAQRFQIKRTLFLNEMLIVAGGLTERASGEIQIYRQKNLTCQPPVKEMPETAAGEGKNRERFVAARQEDGSIYLNVRISDLLNGVKEANPQILSGDIVTVLEAESIYVIGGVANPKQISARTQITLSRAVASAGGVTKNSDAKKITIYRRSAGETKIIEADLEKIKAGAAEDTVLKAFDIVEVTETGSEKRKFPPVLKIAEAEVKKTSNMPLRVID